MLVFCKVTRLTCGVFLSYRPWSIYSRVCARIKGLITVIICVDVINVKKNAYYIKVKVK